MNPKISVVIVTYNAAKTLEVAILSYIKQDYNNKELIIIDGRSTDETMSIIEKFKQHIVYVVSEPDNGIYDAMNKGWVAATGDYVYYLGADDQLQEGALSMLAGCSNGKDLVYGNVKILQGDGSIRLGACAPVSEIGHRAIMSHQGLIMKRSVIESLGGFNCEYQILADYDLMLRAYLKGYTFHYVDTFVALFYMGGLSAYNLKSDKERLRIHLANKSCKHPYLNYFFQTFKKRLLRLKLRIVG